MVHFLGFSRLSRRWLRFSVLAISILMLCLISTPLVAQSISPPELVQQGKKLYEVGQFEQALSHWQQATTAYQKQPDHVGVSGSLINQAQALSALGLQRCACKTLVQALKLSDANSDRLCDPIVYDKQVFQTNSLPVSLQATGLRSLGNVLRLIGNLEASEAVLRQSWAIAPPKVKADILVSLGNTMRDLGNRDRDRKETIAFEHQSATKCLSSLTSSKTIAINYYLQAIDCYQQASSLSYSSDLAALQAPLNHLGLLVDIQQWLWQNQPSSATIWTSQKRPQMDALITNLKPIIQRLPTSHEGISAQINFARSLVLQLDKIAQNTQPRSGYLASLQRTQAPQTDNWEQAKRVLEQAQEQANTLSSIQAKAYVAGSLGWLAEQRGDWAEAIIQSKIALNLTSQIQAPEMEYQWQWQAGRVLKQQGQVKDAIAAYTQAVTALQATRGDLIAVNPDAQFSLRDTAEPIYRELIDLLLPVDRNPGQAALRNAVDLVDSLQLAELEDFLRCRLTLSQAVRVDQVDDPTAAIFYPIVLRDRLEVIVQISQQPLQRHTIDVGQKQLEQLLRQVRNDLVLQPNQQDFNEKAQQQRSGQVYDWLIRPFQATLAKHSIKTLVFVADGLLRNIPLAALYDSQQQSYLIDHYAIALTPGLKILGAKRYSRDQLRALIAGLTTTSRINLMIKGESIGFAPLQGVFPEVEAIQALLPKSEVLRGNDFTTANVSNRLNSAVYPIVHLASHGNFSSDPQNTFILTDSGPSLTIDELQRVLQDGQQAKPNAIEVLIFSACKTAVGDRRATLGFAGAAIRSGANSTLASLWAVNDGSTALLMKHFYQAFIQSPQPITKAEALRIAQRSLRQDYKLPYYWAPFILVGNWL